MKKRILISILFLCIILSTGCKKKTPDDPKKFLQDKFQEDYQKEIVIDNEEIKTGSYEKEYHIMELHLKENKNLKFQACTFLYVPPAIPVSEYKYVSNYEETVEYDTFVHSNLSNFGTLRYENVPIESDDDNICSLTKKETNLILNDLSQLNELAQALYDISINQELYTMDLKVSYGEKTEFIVTKKEYSKEDYFTKLQEITS